MKGAVMKKTKQIEGVIESMKHNIVQTRRLYCKYHPREEGMIKIIKTLYWVLDLPYGLDIPDHYETGDAHSKDANFSSDNTKDISAVMYNDLVSELLLNEEQ